MLGPFDNQRLTVAGKYSGTPDAGNSSDSSSPLQEGEDREPGSPHPPDTQGTILHIALA